MLISAVKGRKRMKVKTSMRKYDDTCERVQGIKRCSFNGFEGDEHCLNIVLQPANSYIYLILDRGMSQGRWEFVDVERV